MSEFADIPWIVWIMSLVKRLSSWRSYGIITVLFLISFIAVTGRPYGTTQLGDITQGLTVPEMSFEYTPQSVYTLLDMFGEAGRDLYLTRILPLDILFSLCYLFFFAISIFVLLKTIFPLRPEIRGLVLIPVIGGLADIVENIFFIVILLTYPTPLPLIVEGAAICTKLKFISNITSILFIPIAAITAGILTVKHIIDSKKNSN